MKSDIQLVKLPPEIPPYFYMLDKDGQPVPARDLMEWARWMESSKEDGSRQVAYTEFSDGSTLSTVFTPWDHSLGFDSALPVLWETMAFGGFYDMHYCRYTDRETAEKCHAAAAQRIQETIDKKPLEPPALSCFE